MNNRTDHDNHAGPSSFPACAPGQRWISENEPELGLGTVSAFDGRYIDIVFSSENESRRYAVSGAPLRRIVFKPGDSIEDRKGRKYSVTSIGRNDGDGVVRYVCGDVVLRESELADTVNIANPVERLAHGIVDPIRAFDHRADLLQYRADLLASPVRGFVGGRIDLLPHQLYIAEKVSSQRVVRALLADEAGLGKTIEACLILHRLLLTGRVNRILILVPEHLVHQWFVELLRRFNLTFKIFTKEYCEAFDKGTNPFLSDQLGICSLENVVGDQALGDFAVSGGWDMVVVDEAHHLQRNGPAYELVQKLSAKVSGLLLLSATPEQLGLEDHFARLQLLDPHRYTDFEVYKRELDLLQEVYVYIESFLVEHRIDLAKTPPATVMIPVPAGVLNIGQGPFASVPETGPASMSLDRLIDLFGTGSVMFRNTRRNIAGFPERSVHVAPLDGDTAAKNRLRAEFEVDTALSNGKKNVDVAPDDPRVFWLAQLLKKQKDEKFLVICSTKEKALSLQQALQGKCKVDVAMFHEAMTILQSDRNAAWFSEEKGARVLISSEMGSEGRNFQFCRSLVLFDLPMNPELVEQRIGRLDRIGQRSVVRIYVPYVNGTPQETLCRWYHEGVDAFGKNEPAAARVFEAQSGELHALLTSPSVKAAPLGKLLLKSRELEKRYNEQMLNARDKLFEIASFHQDISRTIIAGVRADDTGCKAMAIMDRLFERYGVAVEEAGAKKQALLTEYVTDHAFPLPRGERPVITYDRQTALDREEVEFLTIDHPMVRDALDLYLSSDHATTAFALVPDPLTKELALEMVFIIECIAPSNCACHRFLPPVPLRVVVNHSCAEVTALYPLQVMRTHGANGAIQRYVANRKASEVAVPKMLKAGNEIAAARAKPMIDKAIETMRTMLDGEITRLRYLQKGNPVAVDAAIEQCLAERTELEKAYRSARVRLEMLRVIWRGPVKEKQTVDHSPETDDD
jgi:ATP-dependent helicase HepA